MLCPMSMHDVHDQCSLRLAGIAAGGALPRPSRVLMPRSPQITRTVPALRRAVDDVRKRTATIALMPTMGPLDDGHVSLAYDRNGVRHPDGATAGLHDR
jgi:pantoate--beta-alanine ligase